MVKTGAAGLGVLLSLLSFVCVFPSGAQAVSGRGCLVCHEGIEKINEKMQPYLISFANVKYRKGAGYECAVCHEGDPDSREGVHKGLIPNPSSRWVLHQGSGCAACHMLYGNDGKYEGGNSAILDSM